MNRRAFTAVLAAGTVGAVVGARASGRRGASPASATIALRYGDDPSQVADLHLPAGSSRIPVVVVVHGGFWRHVWGKELATPLAADLATAGYAGCALEYRRVGNGGGWPTTFDDVAAAIDALAVDGQDASGDRLDLDRVVAVGHSAGGHLATWAAARAGLPAGAPGAAPAVPLIGAVSQAGVVDLVGGAHEGLGAGAVTELMEATPDTAADSYALASAYERLPIGVPVALVHGQDDDIVPVAQSERYHQAAAAAGDDVRLVVLPGVGHFELIDPAHAAWAACRAEIARLLNG
jgi:acetyl esterase/lipase